MIETRITRLLGIKYPIICGCMNHICTPEFAAAVSNAGALGTLSSTIFRTTNELRDGLRRTKDLTDQPFAFNVNLWPAVRPISAESYVDVALDEEVPILETSGRSPEHLAGRIKQGAIFMHKCARVRDAVSAERMGADAVTLVGFEAGGHPGMDDETTLVLVPMAADAVAIPVIAAGGVSDGRGLAAALALGAEGVAMGTRFMATTESLLHDAVKEWMMKASAPDSVIIQRTLQNNDRVMRTSTAIKVLEMEARGTTLEEVLPLISGEKGRRLVFEGDLDSGIWPCGLGVGMIKDMPTVKELVSSMVDEFEAFRRRLTKY